MDHQKDTKKNSYFKLRDATQDKLDKSGKPPVYLEKVLPKNKSAKIIDIGCGFGGVMYSLQNSGYENVSGIDLSNEAINFCKENGLETELIDDIRNYSEDKPEKFDFATMTHVIEHIKKDDIIDTLISIRKMLAPGGSLYILTPNARARCGAYWAYEDFTHEVLFTFGSLSYVLKAAGFSEIAFLDKDGIENSRFKFFKKVLLTIYRIWTNFWDKAIGVAYHKETPRVDTWEIKVIAKK